MPHYKATRTNGTDFYSGKIDYAAALKDATPIVHPAPGALGSQSAGGYISVATVPTDCTAFQWPCRLFEVEPVGESWAPSRGMPNKRAAHKVKVVAEIESWRVFGPRGEGCAAIIDRFATLTYEQRLALADARDSAWWDAWNRACAVALGGRAGRAGLDAARYALCDRLRGWRDDGFAACGAALAVLFSGFPDLALSREDYAALTAPWRAVVGKAHPVDRLKAVK